MRKTIDCMPVIDTHEHLPHNMDAVPIEEQDVLNRWLRNYTGGDIRSAGLSEEKLAFARDSSKDILERWKIIEPYWEVCKHTAYGRSIRITARDIYGIEDVSGSTIEELSKAHKKIYKKDFMYELMHERLHIEKAILDGFTGTVFDKDERLFARVWRPPVFIGIEDHLKERGVNPSRFRAYEKEYGKIHTLDDWMGVFKCEYGKIAPHIVALKFAMAYMRSLVFEKVCYAEARDLFSKALQKWHNDGERDLIVFPKPLQDYMLRYILDVNVAEYNLPIQVHTGYQEGAGNIIENANPLHLNQLIMDYKQTHFDIFHLGWPYAEEALAMVKILSNTSLNFCWVNIISPSIARRMYIEAMDMLPLNKLCAFGGDYIPMDLVYGHMEIAKDNFAYALENMVSEKVFTRKEAEKCAYMMLYENPRRIYQL